MDKWILVDDRLPEYCNEVLAVFKGWDGMIFQRTLEYDKDCEEWSDWNGECNYKVIAWQPLPDISKIKAY